MLGKDARFWLPLFTICSKQVTEFCSPGAQHKPNRLQIPMFLQIRANAVPLDPPMLLKELVCPRFQNLSDSLEGPVTPDKAREGERASTRKRELATSTQWNPGPNSTPRKPNLDACMTGCMTVADTHLDAT